MKYAIEIENLTAVDNLAITTELYGVGKNRIDEVLEIVGLSNVGKKKAKEFSLGMKQRLGITNAMVHSPKILILVVAAIGILSALLLGFEVTFATGAEFTRQLLMAGLSTVMLVPLMILITLIFKSFIAPMVATVAGTLSNVLSMNWEKSYLSPFAIPADISFIIAGQMKMDITFKKADQNA